MNQARRNPVDAKDEIETSINRVLTGFRTATPTEGIEHRILRVLEKRATAPSRWRFTVPATWAFAAASIATVVLCSAHQHRQGTARIASPPSPLAPGSKPLRDARDKLAKSQSPMARMYISNHVSKTTTAAPEPMSTEDALAVYESQAPSHPAPPMPLTEQEQLLVRILRKGDPVELAMLDPKLRSSEEASSRADFDRFFSKTSSPIATPPAASPQPKDGENK